MLTSENILLFIILTVLLLNIQTIVASILIYLQELRKPTVTKVSVDEIEQSVKEIIKPYTSILDAQGFSYQSQVSITPILRKDHTLQHSFYYYNATNGVHAFIDTTPFKGCHKGATISYVSFYESYHMTLTYDCFGHKMMATPDNLYLFDHYYASFDKAYDAHLKERVIEGEMLNKQMLSEEGFHDYTEYIITEMIEKAIAEKIIYPLSEGYRFSLNIAFLKYINRSVKGYKKAAKALKENFSIKNEELSEEKQALHYNSEQLVLAQQLDAKPIESSKSNKINIFLISALSFILFFGLIGIPWTVLPIIVIVLLIHELGHFLTMKYFGYKDTSIFFIPFFGAAAKGEKEKVTPFEEYMVYLAGPLPGIIISIGIGILMLLKPEFRTYEILKDYALMSLVLNYINLLPIFPLDGGKIVQTLLFIRYPKAQFYFFLLSLMVIILSALMLKSILLGFFALILFISINQNYRTSKLVEHIINEQSDTDIKQRVIEELTSKEEYKKESLAKKGSMAKQALKILHSPKPSFLLMIVGLGFYLMLVLAPFIIKAILPPLA